MRLNLTQKKNSGLIYRLLRLQLSELFRTLTQASRLLFLLKGWKIKEREPFTGSTYETRFEPFSLKAYPYDSKNVYVEQSYQIQHCFECIFKLFLKTVFNLFCEIGFK